MMINSTSENIQGTAIWQYGVNCRFAPFCSSKVEKETDSGKEEFAKKRAHLRKQDVLRDPVKGFAGW